MSGRRFFATALLATMLVSACGSTVPLNSSSGASTDSSGLGTSAASRPLDSGSSLPSAQPGQALGSGASGGPTGPGSSGQAAVAGTGGLTGPTGSSLSPRTSGATKAPIRIGALTASGAGKYQASLGFKGASGDQIAMTNSIVQYLNAHGGLGGRKIQLVSYDLDPTAAATDEPSALQAACTFFTQDNHVTAVASILALLPDSFYACMAKAHVPIILADEGASSDFFNHYASTVYMPSGPSYTRVLNESVEALWSAGWLTAKSQVGLVGYDTADVHSIVDKGLLPALQRHGLKLAAALYTATTTAAASEYNGGVLSFKSKGVDRVFFAPGGQPVYFALAAEQQAYHPYYELSSLEYPTVLAANLPADQLVGSMGVNWLPYLDLPGTQRSSVTTPGIAECRKAMAAAQQDYSGSTTLAAATWICDDWMLLREVFAAGATADEQGIRQAAESLGQTFPPASTFHTTLAPGRAHDGAAAYRLIAFQQGCSCYGYITPVRALP
ncbi:MAG: ABC transporter substrate-binding protein [Actinomycetota bacterium]|nr:ABC transporter substrate-binding protein [Actinomycetota bacterium]